MTYVNVLAVALAIVFLSGCLRLYLPAPRARTGSVLSALFLIGLAVTGIDPGGYGLPRLAMMSGFLYFFCLWNQSGSGRIFHGLAAGLGLGMSTFGNLEIVYQLGPWSAIVVVGWLWTRLPVFQKGTLTAAFALLFFLGAHLLFSIYPSQPFPQTSLARDFYVLTYPDPNALGDIAPRTLVDIQVESASPDGYLGESIYWQEGFRNVKTHPSKTIQNWRANINRMVFDFPHSHGTGIPTVVGTGNAAFFTASVCLLLVMAIYPYYHGRKLLPAEVHVIFACSVLGLGFRSFFAAGGNALWPWVPTLGLIICLSFGLASPIRLRRESSVPTAVSV
jgi:hypothetical protein